LTLPVEDAGAGGGGLCCGDVAGFLKEDGEAGVGEDVVGVVGDEDLCEG
jgi:hypothetical protein